MGSIVGRAMTLVTRHFVLFAGTIGVFFIVPCAAAVAILMSVDTTTLLAQMQTTQQPAFTPATIHVLELVGVAYLCIIVALLLGIFGQNAVAADVAEISAGRNPSFGFGIGRAVARAPQLLGASVLGWLIYTAVMSIVAFPIVLIFALVAEAYQNGLHSVTAVSLLITVGIFIGLAVLALALLAGVALTFAQMATVIERRGVMDAIGTALGRVFGRGEWKRALPLAFVAGLISFGVVAAGELFAVPVASIPAAGAALATAVVVIAELAAMAVATTIYAVYFCDLLARDGAAEPIEGSSG